MKVSLFCGGRGASSLISGLVNIKSVKLTLLVNGYDDGKSTGRVREYIGGMLGPSDFRKNISNVLTFHEKSNSMIADLLEFRVNSKTELEKILYSSDHSVAASIPHGIFIKLTQSVEAFFSYELSKEIPFDYNDCAIGNIIIAGQFLIQNRNFNDAIHFLVDLLQLPIEILNVTDGQNLYLYAVGENNEIVTDEGVIVDNPDGLKFKDFYLSAVKTDDVNESREYSCIPDLNPLVRASILDSDLIVYGPGTQFSSLLPSYVTRDLKESINDSLAHKVVVTNLNKDNDIVGYSINDLISFISANLHSESLNTVDQFLLPNDYSETFDFNVDDVTKIQNERVKFLPMTFDGKKHDSVLIARALLNNVADIKGKNIEIDSNFVSIVVPTLNEARVKDCLTELSNYNFTKISALTYEIIVVDGGDDYELQNYISKLPGYIRYIKGSQYRGESFRIGIENSRSNVVAIFPSDREYQISDLEMLIASFLGQKYQYLSGTRSYQFNRNRVNEKRGIISIFGGLISTLLLFTRYKIYISDLLSTLKILNKSNLLFEDLDAKDIDFEAQLLISIVEKGGVYAELPVRYQPRSYSDGKKVKILNGINLLKYLLFR